MNEDNKLFSVVIACYNCENYLDETVNSLINQSLSFEKHIQLILVNDGSEDNTEQICQKYVKEYPNNIIYIFQENQGQGVARNNGINHATGKYINFLDSDDKFSENSFQLVHEFFEKHYDEVDFVTTPIFFFDNETGNHPLNYKFREDKIINL